MKRRMAFSKSAVVVFLCLFVVPTKQLVVRDGQVGFGRPNPANFHDTLSNNNNNMDLDDWNEIFAEEYRQMVEQQENQDDDGDEDVFSGKLSVVDDWPLDDPKTGQVVGLAADRIGNLHVFHRADRKWKPDSFDENDSYVHQSSGPIALPTLFTLNASNGAVVEKWGENLFYMPHGLHLDSEGNFWMTDVAMHQVFKFEPGKRQPSLTLGKAFQPGRSNSDVERFCQPTDVAVTSSGDFYVADGYCLSRILKFDRNGNHLSSFGVDDFQNPHSLALAEDLDILCVADRENMRVLCYNAGIRDPSKLGEPEREYTDEIIGRIYAITYSQPDGVLYGVTGPTGILIPQGFTIDLKDDVHYKTDIIAYWSPDDKGFDDPHALAVGSGGEAIYVGEINPENIWKFEKEGEDQ